MKFRPCIDIHNGKVKQIVGSSLRDENDQAAENYVSEKDAGWYADLYARDGLQGGHVIMLNPVSSPYYEATKAQAEKALRQSPGLLQVGGGIRTENAAAFLDAGASHVIVTSYVFSDGKLHMGNLERIKSEAGREHLVLDLSARLKNGEWFIVTDRWQKFTEVRLDTAILNELAGYCSEFLIHAVDAEGKADGPMLDIVSMLGSWQGLPATYAGGIGSYEDIQDIARCGLGRVDFTVGSALDMFGGSLAYDRIKRMGMSSC